MEHPLLYVASKEGQYFTVVKFVTYLMYALFHALIIFSLTYLGGSDM